jgi:hypothetical protein
MPKTSETLPRVRAIDQARKDGYHWVPMSAGKLVPEMNQLRGNGVSSSILRDRSTDKPRSLPPYLSFRRNDSEDRPKRLIRPYSSRRLETLPELAVRYRAIGKQTHNGFFPALFCEKVFRVKS